MARVSDFLKEWADDEPYIIAHTSGSTGTPKEIRLLKSDMRISARATNAFFGLGPKFKAACPLSVDYIAGKMMAVRALEGQYTLTELPVSNDITLPDDDSVYDLMPVVPSQLPSLLQKPYAKKIRNLLIGGASPAKDILEQIIATGYNAYISYGMTETCSHVALRKAAEDVYKAMPGIHFCVDERDCLVIEAPHFSFGRLVTNDVVELLSDTAFRWHGRADNVINSAGLKLQCEELEKLYEPYLNGKEYYVVGRPSSEWGTAVAIVVEGSVDKELLLEKLRAALPHRLCPKIVETVDSLPRTPNGKVKRI